MEHNEQLKNYIQTQLGAGLSPDEIAAHLKNAGWQEDMIASGFRAVQAASVPSNFPGAATPTESQPVEQHTQPMSQEPVITNAEGPWQAPTEQTFVGPSANGRKRGRIKTGWMLFQQSFAVLRGNKHLLRYLFMTGLWIFIITIAMVGVYIALYRHQIQYDYYTADGRNQTNILGFLLLALNYVLVYFVINYYAAGMTANVFDIFRGERRPYKQYMQVARKKAGTLFFYSLIAATVGVLLQYIAERVRFVGWIISWLLGTLWSLGTLFVVPIIITSDNGAPSSIKQSIKFFKANWGETVVSKVTVNVPLALINVLLILLFVPMVYFVAAATHSIAAIIILFILFFCSLLIVAIIGSFANSLLNIALFYFAQYRQVPPSFSADLLNSVFVNRKKNKLLSKLSTK